MRLAFIVDPLDQLTTYKDSSIAMMREAAARGHELYALGQEALRLRDGRVSALVRRLELTSDEHHWYAAGEPEEAELTRFDWVLMRKDPPFDMEYVYSTYLLELAEAQGARVINNPRSLRDFNEKLAIAKFPQYTAPTLVTRETQPILEFLAGYGDIVLKPLDGMGGSGVFRVRAGDPNVNVIIETVTRLGRKTAMAQRYIPEIAHGDKRILLVNGKPAPYALARIPKPGETRGNLAAGGTGVAQPLSARDREIAEGLGPILAEQGLFLVGLDVIGDYLTEINVTSPTCMQEIAQQTGFSVAGMMIEALEAAC